MRGWSSVGAHVERPEIVVQALEWHPSGATEPFRLALPEYFAEVFDEG